MFTNNGNIISWKDILILVIVIFPSLYIVFNGDKIGINEVFLQLFSVYYRVTLLCIVVELGLHKRLYKKEKISLLILLIMTGIVYMCALLSLIMMGLNIMPRNIAMQWIYSLGLVILNIYFVEDYFIPYLMKRRRISNEHDNN